MTRVKLKCIMGCPGLKSRYWEKRLFTTTQLFYWKGSYEYYILNEQGK